MLATQVIAADWPAPGNVRAFATTRAGGMSYRPFDSLNLAMHVGDEPRRVAQNRELLATELQLPSEPAWLDQQHGAQVVAVDRGDGHGPPARADAAVARRTGRVCAVLTADCLPVLLCNRDGTRVAAVHAGWRGLAGGVLESTVAALNAPGGELLAWLGPAIGQQAYEIDEPVRRRLLMSCPQAADAFEPGRAGHWHADLAAIARRRLHGAGVQAVFGGGFCTYSDSDRFYSHRREGRCGRMASLIWLQD